MQSAASASKARATAIAAVLLAVAALSGPAEAVAVPGTAVGSAANPAVPADRCQADSPPVRHLVLFDPGTGVGAARAAVTAGCGVLTGYYPEIAVAVATSADWSFADRLGRDRAYSAEAETVVRPPKRPPTPMPRTVGVQSTAGAGSAETEAETEAEAEAEAADRSAEQWDMSMIGADQAHDRQRGRNTVLVGVLDSGVDADHPELAAAVDRSASAGCLSGMPDPRPQAWRPSGEHGTHVAGIIAAADDGAGVTGVAPGVRIAAVKVVDAAGFIYPEYAVCGLVWAARTGMRIVNHSYFVDPWLFTCAEQPGQSVVYEALRRAAGYATAQGVLSVAAAGNEALDLTAAQTDTTSPNNARSAKRRVVDGRCDVLPAELPGVLTVSAVGADGVKSSYSSYGAGVVDVAAPGGDTRQRSPAAPSGCVLSTVPGGYGRMCGTSMAAPHAAGVAALVASAHPDAGPAEVASLVKASATPLACPQKYDPNSDGTADARCTTGDGGTSFYGAGLVNAAEAVNR